MNFFTALGLMMIIVLFVAGVLYWIKFLFKKLLPNFKYQLKYKILRRKHKQADVEMLMDYLANNVSKVDLQKSLLLNGKATPKKAKELLYIYQGMQKLQGGEIK